MDHFSSFPEQSPFAAPKALGLAQGFVMLESQSTPVGPPWHVLLERGLESEAPKLCRSKTSGQRRPLHCKSFDEQVVFFICACYCGRTKPPSHQRFTITSRRLQYFGRTRKTMRPATSPGAPLDHWHPELLDFLVPRLTQPCARYTERCTYTSELPAVWSCENLNFRPGQ